MPAKPHRIAAQFNPFGEAAFGSPWQDVPADVPSIHQGAFKTLMLQLEQARKGKASVVITGEPGSGKTHLLWRLRHRIAQEAAYIYIRCNASSTTLWRHVRAAVVKDLLKQENGEPSRLQFVLRKDPGRLEKVSSRNLRQALTHYGEGRHVHAASAWLAGEALPDSDLEALGIGVERDDEERSRESEARSAVHGLLKLLEPDLTVLCFDQVEALQTYRGDDEGFHTMSTLVADLCDEHQQLLLVTCLVSAFEDLFDRLPNKANRDRWLDTKITLRPIDWDDAERLVRSRLDSSPELAQPRRERPGDLLYPLDAERLKPLFESTGLCLPRTLIQACKAQFESLFGDEDAERVPELSREDFLQQEFARNLSEARRTVERQGGEKTLAESLPWLMQNSGYSPLGPAPERSHFANLAFAKEDATLAAALSFGAGNALTNQLNRMERYWKPEQAQLRILRNAAVTPGAKAALVLARLKEKGAQEIHPLPEALAALQALHNMIASARSGDLRQGAQGVAEPEVTRWALSNLPPQLEKLREQLAGTPVVDLADPMPKLAELLRRRKVIHLDAAALELKLTPEEVSACAYRHPMRFGLLAGPPLVLFEPVEGPAAASPDA